MDNEQLLLLLRGLTHTETISVPITANNLEGVPLGQGECKAVTLRLNNFAHNSTNGTAATAMYFYWGNTQKQDFEVLRGVNSQVIFTDKLENICIRCPFTATTYIQVMIYT